MIGRTLGRYCILEKIGAGGMGEVYRAHDERLDRDVALKVLPGGALKDKAARHRFRKEALALSRLDHPNVVSVHDFDSLEGVDFLVMSLVPGASLEELVRGSPLPETEILRLASQLAEGLLAAHEQGVVHRDLKPGNLRVTPEGRLEILDFGLADLRRPAREDASTGSLTEQGVVAGTVAYMAPEQLLGEATDLRVDIYGAGAVLYEMATGRRPFLGSGAALIDAVLHQALEAPSRYNPALSPGLDAVVLKALAKEPQRRHQSCRELLRELESLGAPAVSTGALRKVPRRRVLRAGLVAAAGVLAAVAGARLARLMTFPGMGGSAPSVPAKIKLVAVLPFDNLAPDPSEAYLSRAVSLELTTRLGEIGALRVAPWTFMKRFEAAPKSLGEVAQATGADAVVEGTVEIIPRGGPDQGPSLQIVARLFNTRSGLLMWSGSFRREFRDLLGVPGEIAHQITGQIQVKLARREQSRLSASRRADPEAVELYLRGREAAEERSQKGLEKAAEYFRLATQKDPRLAEAYVGLADASFLLSAYFGALDAREAYRRAIEATSRALEIDSSLGEAWASQAFARSALGWEWHEADSDFKRALVLSPSSGMVRHWYADYLTAMGRHSEAIEQSLLAEQRMPLSATASRRVAWSYFFARRYEDAIQQLHKTLAIEPGFVPARTLLGRAYVQTRTYDRGIAELKDLGPPYRAMLAAAFAAAGQRAEAERVLREVTSGWPRDPVHARLAEGILPSEVALVHAVLGDADAAFAWLERAYREHDPEMVTLRVHPVLDPLRGDPRYADLLRRMGFPPEAGGAGGSRAPAGPRPPQP